MSPNDRRIDQQPFQVGVFREDGHDLRPDSLASPAVETLERRVPVSQPFRQVPPGYSRFGDPENGIEEEPIVCRDSRIPALPGSRGATRSHWSSVISCRRRIAVLHDQMKQILLPLTRLPNNCQHDLHSFAK